MNFKKYLTAETVIAALILIVTLAIFTHYKWMAEAP